jgi:hypothetical protein
MKSAPSPLEGNGHFYPKEKQGVRLKNSQPCRKSEPVIIRLTFQVVCNSLTSCPHAGPFCPLPSRGVRRQRTPPAGRHICVRAACRRSARRVASRGSFCATQRAVLAFPHRPSASLCSWHDFCALVLTENALEHSGQIVLKRASSSQEGLVHGPAGCGEQR